MSASHDTPKIEARKGTKEEVENRRVRVLEYRIRDGFTLQEIATLEKCHVSQISRDMKWWGQYWKRVRRDPRVIVGELETRFDAIYDRITQEMALVDRKSPTSHRDMARLNMVALAASIAKKNLLLDVRAIGPDAEDPGKPESHGAAEIRRLADEVKRLTGGETVLLPEHTELMSDGERAWIDGETIADDDDATT
jgi:hypothetical protein